VLTAELVVRPKWWCTPCIVGEDKSKTGAVNDFVILAAAKALKEVPQAYLII
jgi:hypothetical protein